MRESFRDIKRDQDTHAYRADIDGLRAVAVGMVLIFHAWPRFLPGGFVGVDIFFVISGFLITGIIFPKCRRGTFSYLDFFARRLRRIGPALLTVIIVFLTLGFIFFPYGVVRELAIEAAAGAGFSANILFWLQADYFDGLNGTKPLLHLWSLGVEEQFYLIWPTLMVVAVALGKRGMNILTLLAAVAVASFAADIVLTMTFPEAAFYLLPGRLWQLAIGGVLACSEREGRPKRSPGRSDWETTIGLCLIAASAILLNELRPYPGWWALLPTIGAVLILDAGPGAWFNRYVLASMPFRRIGLISYPLYLWHWPSLVFLGFAGYATAVWKAVTLSAAVLLSYLTFKYIEKPIRFGARQKQGGIGFAARAILGGLAVVAAFSLALPGLHLRIIQTPAWAVAFEDRREEFRAAYRYGKCFLTRSQEARDFAADCWTGRAPQKPAMLLWGDSHAAQLYPGLSAKEGDPESQFNLIQLTTSACPPIVGISRVAMSPNCAEINRSIEEFITQKKPGLVVLAAAWVWYLGDRIATISPGDISRTIEWLRSNGVERVVVIGPMPRWEAPLPRLLLKVSQGADPPQHIHGHMNPGPSVTEASVRDATLAAGGHYVSAIEALCDDAAGCLSSIMTTAGAEPSGWDEDHLTAAGSKVMINVIWRGGIAPYLSH
jgi:peptidoglycan/LPS O-acetylase OafA/YrhL